MASAGSGILRSPNAMRPFVSSLKNNGISARSASIGLIITLTLFVALLGTALADVVGVVHGHVTVAGSARAGVMVTVVGENGTFTATSDAHGDIVLPRVPFGQYQVRAHVDGQSDLSLDITVASEAVANFQLDFPSLGKIGYTSATATGVGGAPVSENTLSQSSIATLPQAQNLDRVLETLPGIVRFSYDEPVAHGFHGLTYEVDGAPLPQTTNSAFSELLDPSNISTLEVVTGPFPAEFGGQRQGAVVNIVTKSAQAIPNGAQTFLSLGTGSYGEHTANISQARTFGDTNVYAAFNTSSTERGLDAPTASALHDNANLSDGFLRTVTKLSPLDTVAFDFSTQYNAYQIPINTDPTSTIDPASAVASQDDVQREYNAFANLNYTHLSADGNGYLQLIPWWRYQRFVYAGDLASDVLAVDNDSSGDCDGVSGGTPCYLAGLNEDRVAKEIGVRGAFSRTLGRHVIKIGAEGSVENLTSTDTIATTTNLSPPVPGATIETTSHVAQRGTNGAIYAQDNWNPIDRLGLQLGLRYDLSHGFTEGNELQPRLGANYRVGDATILHAYYGRIYAAPTLEDTRADAVIAAGGGDLPVYDLKPEHDSYYEFGVERGFAHSLRAYADIWERNAWNVLDTTQIFPTPIFATYNNSLGLAHGLEVRLTQSLPQDAWYFSGTFSQSVAGGISGGTFLFAPDDVSDTSLQPEDHDQAVAIKAGYTKRFGGDLRTYVTLDSDYGTGYPVQFQDGPGRLPPHLTFDSAIGRAAQPGKLGYKLSVLNLTNYQYLIKINNGFNTTQWAAGRQANFTVSAAL
jgi:outer membrane receptor protein involved in Fe transport